MSWTIVLRPIYRWFHFWEGVIPSLYRVVATVLAATGTAAVLAFAAGMFPAVAVAVSLPAWVGLAIVQEHDERVRLPPDGEFVAELTAALSSTPPSLSVVRALGPTRARPEEWDTSVELSADGAADHPLSACYISLDRSAAGGWMHLYVTDDLPDGLESIHDRLDHRGEWLLADRIQHARSPRSDAEAIANALAVAYW